MQTLETLIHFLDKKREEQGIKKQSYCAKLEITPQFYHLILTGKSKPNAEILLKMADIVGLKLVLAVKM